VNYDTLLFTVEHRIGTVTINRPDKLNALNAGAKEELRQLFTALTTDTLVDAVIVTGAGEKAFVAGTDIGELTALDGLTGAAFAEKGQAVFDLIEHLGKPVIAAVNGYALGGGCELALACHMRIATERARFGQPEVSLGIIPGYGGTQRLARLIGKGRAMEMILTGVQVDAAEALRIGLVNRVVPGAELLTRAMAMARAIGSQGQVAVRAALEAVNAADALPLPEGLRNEADLFGRCCGSEDFREGTRAFLEKRKPAFRNR
jgi:enoyl-CoA hydratase